MLVDASIVQSDCLSLFENGEISFDASEKSARDVVKTTSTDSNRKRKKKTENKQTKEKKKRRTRVSGIERKKTKTHVDVGNVSTKSEANLTSECFLYEQMRSRYFSILHHFHHLRSRYEVILQKMEACQHCSSEPPPPPPSPLPSSRYPSSPSPPRGNRRDD